MENVNKADIIELKHNVDEIYRILTGNGSGGGLVTQIELIKQKIESREKIIDSLKENQLRHGEELASRGGRDKTILWFLGGLSTLFAALAAVVLQHML